MLDFHAGTVEHIQVIGQHPRRQVTAATDGHNEVGTKPGGVNGTGKLAGQQRELVP
jgi:hypothetical protein